MKRAFRRRLIQFSGVLELLAACTIVVIGIALPGATEVEATFGGARELAHISRMHIETSQSHLYALHGGTIELAVGMKELSQGLEAITATRYPSITLNGLTPTVEWKRLWPEEYDPAPPFRRVVVAAEASEQELANLLNDLPAVQASLADMESALEGFGRQTAVSLAYVRVLLWFVGSIVCLHGLVLIGSAVSDNAGGTR